MRNAPAFADVPPRADALDPGLEAAIFTRATAVDEAAAFPRDDIAALAMAGLLMAPLPIAAGGGGVGMTRPVAELRSLLSAIGRASLTVGRLFEGHVNAAKLVARYGGPSAVIAAEAAAGRISGVWNAERGPGLRAAKVDGGWRLDGRKIHCSGAGSIRRALVTARDDDDAVRLFLPDLTGPGVGIDLGVWRAAGMRGTATGTVDFARVFVPDAATVGGPGDYYRSPLFSGGAWRVLAVQLGGLERVMHLHAARLTASGRGGDQVFRARFARAAGSAEAARLLVAEVAERAEAGGDPAAIDAYVDLARATFEDLALGCIDAVRRNVGLSTFIAPDPLDRVLRDLETYLRQPFVDASRDHAAAWLLEHEGRLG
ncbi:MAG: acyl-CoA dehydrogenase family protein [Janthinobacterium lividum]